MRQAQRGFQHAQQRAACSPALGRIRVVQFHLGQFQIPVAVVVPDEAVDGVGRQIEAVFGQRLRHLGRGALQPGHDPAVHRAEVHVLAGAAVLVAGFGKTVVVAFHVHQHEAGGIPQLVAEVAVALTAADVEIQRAREIGQRGEGEAQRIRAEGRNAVGKMLFDVLLDARLVIGPHQAPHRLGQQRLLADAVDQVQRIQRVALGLRHLLPFRVTDDGIDVDVPERHLAGEILGHHHHPGYPEEDDVVARHQHVGRQIARQVRLRDRIFRRPAQRGERHQRRREPGIQHVGVAGQRPGIAGGLRLLAGLLLAAGHEGLAILAIPGRNPVSPPQLARNAPVVDVREPVVVGGCPVLGEEADPAGSHRLQRRPGDGRHAAGAAVGLRLAGLVHEPLVGQHRLDHLAGAATDRHHVAVLHGIDQQAGGIQIGHHLLARPVAVHTSISLWHGLAGHIGFQVQHHDQRQLVTLGHLVIVEIVRAGDLHAAAAEFRIHITVGNHRDLPAGQRQFQQFAVQVAVAFILRMHGHGHVAQHRFRTGGGHHQPRQFGAIGRPLRAIGKRIADVPQMAIALGHVHLEVGHGRA